MSIPHEAICCKNSACCVGVLRRRKVNFSVTFVVIAEQQHLYASTALWALLTADLTTRSALYVGLDS